MEAEDFRFKMQVVWRGLQLEPGGGGGHLGFLWGGMCRPGLQKTSPKIDTPF